MSTLIVLRKRLNELSETIKYSNNEKAGFPKIPEKDTNISNFNDPKTRINRKKSSKG